ncbi:hypothetical protein [Arcobacter sp. LA11]|uniref:hypothetical protein n=1 Tax=Arcobacter sp. LA11 TaxID=1898176 RepID=UPI0009347E57|nr:hypothetical protein [Arcobacter sp. LA11]
MLNIRNLFILFFIVINLNASMQKDVIYVENFDGDEISIKDEFFNKETDLYTISIGTLTLDRHDPIDFFKTYKMKNALAYKYGENKEFARVISGVYKTGTEATEHIKNLDPRLQKNKPYSAKLKRHQVLYTEELKVNKSKIAKNSTKTKKNTKLNEVKNSIYTTESQDAQELKKEFLTNGSKYYSIALGSISLSKNSIQNFFNTYDVGDKALAHIYGKNKDKARIIYGLYRTSKEAREALENFNSRLKKNKPFSMRMKKFQSFYNKNFPNGIESNNIVELKINDKKEKEKAIKPKLSDEIKIVKKNEVPKKVLEKKIKPKVTKPKIVKPKIASKPKIKQKPKKKVVKKIKPKKLMKEDLNKSRFVKYSELEDVYFIESNGSFNILNEVFLNDGSSFYTVDLGELKLNQISIEQFFLKNNMEDDALAYKYGDNDEYARAIYGAYETKEAASKAIKSLNVSQKDLRVSNIKNHQKLYKEYHKDVYNKNTKKQAYEEKKIVNSSFSYDGSNDNIVYVETNGQKNLLKNEFFNKESSLYTITLITFLKENMSIEKFLNANGIKNDALGYSIGSVNNYYRVIYGLYETSTEAKEAIQNLNYELRKNIPYVSRIITNQKKFESYNNRILEDEINNIKKLEF